MAESQTDTSLSSPDALDQLKIILEDWTHRETLTDKVRTDELKNIGDAGPIKCAHGITLQALDERAPSWNFGMFHFGRVLGEGIYLGDENTNQALAGRRF
jgi:hypothetical protein